uniref:BOD1/SHG1 domain-containing protein n=1 Tax=Biomphalaria glabrata TaxID=6526 RepID=A0A2C9JDF1_BIOGL
MEQENLQHDEDGNKDSEAIEEVINKVKSQGLFDQFRKECLADVDTKPAYHNLIQRVEKFVERFLNGQKWTSNVNKNQLRETLRRQLNNSGIMSIGVDRIIEQVVNPKILLGIKPRIDEAVCEHLGIDLKSRQEEQQRRKQEKQRLMLQNQQLHQQHMQDMMNQNMKNDESFSSGSGILPTPNDMSWSPGNSNFLGGPGGPGPGMGPGSGVPYNMGFGGMMQPFSFMGPWGPGLPGMEGFNQTMNPMIPGQPMIPPFPPAMPDPAFNTSPRPAQSTPDFSKPPPGLQGSPLMNANSSIGSSPGVPGLSTQSSPVAPPGIHPVPVGPIIRPPPPGSVPPPPGTVPVMAPLIPPGAPMAPPVSPLVRPNVPTTPNIPALISHTLSKVSKDELTPEKIAVFKTAAAFITKTVSNAQGTPGGADLATMFSPRVLAEAMMAESGVPLSKHEIRAAKRKERMKEYERLKAERDKEEAAAKKKEAVKAEEDPLPPKHNLMDVFQAAEDVSDDEEAFNMLIDESETEDRHKQGIVLSEDSDKEDEEQPPTIQPGKRYNFAWDVDKDGLSDVTVSSIHTSDISSFDTSSSESLSEEEEDKPSEATEENLNQEDKEDNSQINADIAEPKDEKPAEVITTAAVPDSKETKELAQAKDTEAKLLSQETEVKLKGSNEMARPRKLVSLSYRYSDSEEEETREERKARIAKEKEERYMKRQQRRAEMEAKRKEREDEKARLKEEKKKLEEDKKDETQIEAITDDVSKVEDPSSLTSVSVTSVTDQESPNKSSPKKRRKKAELKEQLHQQKVLERKAALSRRRTRNRRYASEEFTSIFTERKSLNQSYTDPPADIVTFDGSLEVVEMTVDQECVVETVSETVDVVDGEKTEDLTLQCPSPYSDISDKSMSSEDQNMGVEMEQVSSDEDLDSGEDIDEDASKDVKSSVEFDETEVSQESSVKNIAPTRSNSTAMDVTDKRKSPELTENRNSRSQRYEVDDLYKPRTNRRRATSPPTVPLESKVIAGTDSQSDDDRFSQKSHSLVSSQTVSQSSEQEAEKVSLVTATAAEEDAGVKEPVDIMADLELEPVSDEEETPLEEICVNNADGAEQEDGEEEDSDEPISSVKKETPPSTETPLAVPAAGQKEDDDASDEGEIKSSSEDDKIDSEEEKERAAHRKPIELVDFGEAEKRARGSRGYFPEVVDRRPIRGSATHSSYRGGYTWTSTEPPSYVPNVQRYPVSHEGILTSHSKSPLGYDGADSEASSQSRCSVRLRDDVPPPYPIEGVNTRKRRSPLSEVGSSGLYKPVSPPSPVSSSSSSSSRSVGSYSWSRSSSHSRSSSLSSTSSSHSSREKAKRKKKRRRRRSSRNKEVSNVRQKFSSSKSLDTFSPIKGPEIMPKVVSEPQLRERLLSSGHESISSDELPYFPDDEPQPPPSPPKVKVKRRRSSQCDSSTGSSSSKSPVNKKQRCSQSPGKESISSSELIYSPTRLKSPKKMSEAENDDDDNLSIERPPMSPGRSSISSGELPDYPEQDLEGFSPHHPPLQQEDIDRFQPPLPPSPQNFDINPPLPPPLPEMPPEPSHSPPESRHLIPEAPPSSPEEDGEITEETEFSGAENSVTEKASCVQMSNLDSTIDTQPEIQCEEPSPQPSLSPKDSAPAKEDIVIPLLEVSEHSSSTPPHSEPPLLIATKNYSRMTSSQGISECIPEKVKTAVEESDSGREGSDNTVVECSSINSNTDNRQSLTVVNDKDILPTRVQLSDIETQEQSGIQRDEMLTIDDVSEIPSGATDSKSLKGDVDEASGTFIGECIQKTNFDHSLSRSLGEEAHEPTVLESLGEVCEPEASISVDEVHEPEASESVAKVHEPADSESVDRTHEPKASESV